MSVLWPNFLLILFALITVSVIRARECGLIHCSGQCLPTQNLFCSPLLFFFTFRYKQSKPKARLNKSLHKTQSS